MELKKEELNSAHQAAACYKIIIGFFSTSSVEKNS